MLARIREEYWIPQGWAQVKKILRKCSNCKLHEGIPYVTPPIPRLPHLRLIDDVPFTCTGVDHFGTLYMIYSDGKNVQEKVWICLLTCAIVWIIHLEVTTELIAEHLLMAILCFIARRGVPKYIISDNTQGFKLTGRILSCSSWKAAVIDLAVQKYCSEMKTD